MKWDGVGLALAQGLVSFSPFPLQPWPLPFMKQAQALGSQMMEKPLYWGGQELPVFILSNEPTAAE